MPKKAMERGSFLWKKKWEQIVKQVEKTKPIWYTI
jgi:hypothetical protein